jgi:hypothetical protein
MKGFPGPKVFGLAAWEDFRQRKSSHAAGGPAKDFKDFRCPPWEGFPGPGSLPLAAWEVFRQRKTSHAAGSMPASERLRHGAGGLKKIQTRLGLNHAAYFFKAKDFRSKKIQSIFLRQLAKACWLSIFLSG